MVQGGSALGFRMGQLSIKKRPAGDDPCDGAVTKRRKVDGQVIMCQRRRVSKTS